MSDYEIPRPNIPFIRVVTGVFRVLFKLYFRLECHGLQNLEQLAKSRQPFILVANHTSNLDAAVIGSCMKPELTGRLSVPGKRELFDNWKTAWFMHALGMFPVDRDVLDLSAARGMMRILRSGRGIAIAPEGTRSPDGRVRPFKSGFVKVALKYKIPVVPVGVQGSHEALPKYTLVPKPKKIIVRFGKPMDLSSYAETVKDSPPDEALAEIVRQEVIRLCEGRAADGNG